MTGDPIDDEALAEAVDWRMRIDAAPDDAALRAALDAWLAADEAHRSAWRDVERLAQVASVLPADYADAQGALRGDGGLGAAGTLARPGIRPAIRRRRLAVAVVALAACLAFLFLPGIQLWLASDHRTGTAELRGVTLEDGSVVTLDGESAIAVRYADGRREVVLLSGRAYFEVVPSAQRPFVVVADQATVTVTGTAFDVGKSTETLSVAVQSGTVEVALEPGKQPAATLRRGERLAIDRRSGTVARSEIVPSDVAAWRTHRLIVDRATIADVVRELERHYPGVVVLRGEALAARRVSGVFDLRQPFEALEAVVRTHGGSAIRITPWIVIVSEP
jgi:transmembrane sensor